MEDDEDIDFNKKFLEEERKKERKDKYKYVVLFFLILVTVALIVFFAVFLRFEKDPTPEPTCTPYYPEKNCICQTKYLSCEDFDKMYNSISEKIFSLRPKPSVVEQHPSAAYQVGKLVAGMLRLAFHDAAEYDPESHDDLRSDGCINLDDPGNNGLKRIIDILDELWIPFCDKISRADFWYLAAKVALETSTPYTDRNNTLGLGNFKRYEKRFDPQYSIPNFNIPFYYGRIDELNCSYAGESRLPSAEKNVKEIERVFITHLGLDTRSIVALMGGHSLGSLIVTESGYDGVWQTRMDLFDTEFFQNLVSNKWFPQPLTDSNGHPINQWQHSTSSNVVMLNTDVELLYDVDPSQTLPDQCGPYVNTSTIGCPKTSDNHPNLDFPYWTTQFAEGDATTNDQPGSSKWLSVFARAFHQMCSVGYQKDELICAECQTPNCDQKCSNLELCEGPQYGLYSSK